MTKKLISTKILKFAKKIKMINLLGEKCEMCHTNNIFHLCFHHPDKNKESNLCELKLFRFSKIEKELKKCILLCNNCHKELHANIDKNCDSYSTILRRKTKKLLLGYKNCKCEKCGYDKNQTALVFHHTNGDDKLFIFNAIRINVNKM
jgi:hypothetical protein